MSEKKTYQQNAEERRVAEFRAQVMTTRCCLCRWNSGELPSSDAHAAFEKHLAEAHPDFEPRIAPRGRGGKRSGRSVRQATPRRRAATKA